MKTLRISALSRSLVEIASRGRLAAVVVPGMILVACADLPEPDDTRGPVNSVQESELSTAGTQEGELLSMSPRVPFESATGMSVRCREGVCETRAARGYTEQHGAATTIPAVPHVARGRGRGHERATARALELAEERGDAMMTVAITLEDPEFDWARERREGQSARGMVARRQAQLRPIYARLERDVQAMGGELTDRHWLACTAVARIPASAMSALPDLDGFARLDAIGDPEDHANHVLEDSGAEIAEAIQLFNPVTQWSIDEYYNWAVAGRAGGRVNLAVIEPDHDGSNRLNCDHAGWSASWAPNGSRLVRNQRCLGSDSWVWCRSGAVCGAEGDPDHINSVTAIAASSIRANQSLRYPGFNTPAQRAHSGMSRYGEIQVYTYDAFYEVDGDDDGNANRTHRALIRTIEEAVEHGADVINLSWGDPNRQCDVTYDPLGISTVFFNAMNTGAVLVSSAGNRADDGGPCNVTWPAYDLSIVSVGALANGASANYEASVLHEDSSYGYHWDASISGTSYSSVPTVDIVVPGYLHDLPAPEGPDSYLDDYQGGRYASGSGGTSFAAAVVSGVMGYVVDMFDTFNLERNPWTVMAYLFMQGDGVSLYGGTNDGTLVSTVGSMAGYGRLRLMAPRQYESASEILVDSAWIWGDYQRVYQFNDGNPLPSDTTGFKAALIFHHQSMQEMPFIRMELVDTCPASGGIRYLRRSAFWNGPRQRIIENDPGDLANACVELRVRNYTPRYGAWVHIAAGYFDDTHAADNYINQ